jgi:hypothetical protein
MPSCHVTLPRIPSTVPETETWFPPWAPTVHPCSSTCPSIGCVCTLYVLSYQICLNQWTKEYFSCQSVAQMENILLFFQAIIYFITFKAYH